MTTYRVEIQKEQFTFSSAHFITFAGDICEAIHGHNYGVKATIEGPIDVNQYVVDFIAIRDAIIKQTSQLDHHVLLPDTHPEIKISQGERETEAKFRDRRWVFPNEDCVILPVVNTTAEELARVIAERVLQETTDHLKAPLTHFEIGVDENQGQWGVCRLKI